MRASRVCSSSECFTTSFFPKYGRRCHEKLLPAQRNAAQQKRAHCSAVALNSFHWSCRIGRHYCNSYQPAVDDFLAQTPQTRSLLWLLLLLLGTSVLTLISTFVISGLTCSIINLCLSLRHKLIQISAAYHLCHSALAPNARCVWGVSGSTCCHVHDFSLLCLRVGRTCQLLRRDASGTHHLGAANQFGGNWTFSRSPIPAKLW